MTTDRDDTATLMSERSNLIATKAEQLVALMKRATAAEAKVALLTEALKPFATFAENNTDDEGWAGSTCQRDRIVDWFGPSDFRAARRALSEPDKEGRRERPA